LQHKKTKKQKFPLFLEFVIFVLLPSPPPHPQSSWLPNETRTCICSVTSIQHTHYVMDFSIQFIFQNVVLMKGKGDVSLHQHGAFTSLSVMYGYGGPSCRDTGPVESSQKILITMCSGLRSFMCLVCVSRG
jgi:hypothetical protein